MMASDLEDQHSKTRNPLPGFPSVESPFFERLFPQDNEVYPVAKSLHDDGFALIEFPDAEIDEIADRIIDDLTPLYDWEAWRRNPERGPRIAHAYKTNEDVRRLATNEKIIELLSTLYGRKAMPFQTLNFPVGTQQPFHSDSVHFASLPERYMCGVWVALEDITEDNGPLLYFPGSHKLPIFTNEHIGKRRDPITDKYATYDQYVDFWVELVSELGLEAKTLAMKKGQAVIWCANLLHGGSHQNDKSKTRHSQVTHYFFEGCSYYVPVNSDVHNGEIYYHKFHDIATGEFITNKFNGRTVPNEHISLCDVTNKDLARGG
jgi:hypothetical protein